MADGSRKYPVNALVLHHSVGPLMDNWNDPEVSNWFNSTGRTRGYAGVAHSNHFDPYSGAETFSQAHYCLHPYTKDGNKYGWRLTLLMKDPFNNVAWHAGNWPINQQSIGVEIAGRYDAPNPPLNEKALMLLADSFRDWDKELGGGLNIYPHKKFMATACPGQVADQIPTLLDMFNNPEKWNQKLFGQTPQPTPQPQPQPVDWKTEAKPLTQRDYKFKQNGALYEIDTGKVVKTYNQGQPITVSHEYKDYYLTPYSIDRGIKNGFRKSELEVYKTDLDPIVTPEPTPEPPKDSYDLYLNGTLIDTFSNELMAIEAYERSEKIVRDSKKAGTVALNKNGVLMRDVHIEAQQETDSTVYAVYYNEDQLTFSNLKEPMQEAFKEAINKVTKFGGTVRLVEEKNNTSTVLEEYKKDIWAVYKAAKGSDEFIYYLSLDDETKVDEYIKTFMKDAGYGEKLKVTFNSHEDKLFNKDNEYEVWVNDAPYWSASGESFKDDAREVFNKLKEIVEPATTIKIIKNRVEVLDLFTSPSPFDGGSYQTEGEKVSKMFGYSASTGLITGALITVIVFYSPDITPILGAVTILLTPLVNAVIYFSKKWFDKLDTPKA